MQSRYSLGKKKPDREVTCITILQLLVDVESMHALVSFLGVTGGSSA